MPYEEQLEAKIGILRDCLSRIGKINYQDEIKIIPSPKPFNYRARAQWHIEREAGKSVIFKEIRTEVIDVENCPIITPELNETLTDLRENIEWETFSAEIVEIEAANSNGKKFQYSRMKFLSRPKKSISAKMESRYFYSANIFFSGKSIF